MVADVDALQDLALRLHRREGDLALQVVGRGVVEREPELEMVCRGGAVGCLRAQIGRAHV